MSSGFLDLEDLQLFTTLFALLGMTHIVGALNFGISFRTLMNEVLLL